MKKLDEYLLQLFGGRKKSGRRLAAVSDVHAVHEAGYDVSYSRYSVTYRDAKGELALGAEIDEDGTLLVHSSSCVDRNVVERISTALKFLGVKHLHR